MTGGFFIKKNLLLSMNAPKFLQLYFILFCVLTIPFLWSGRDPYFPDKDQDKKYLHQADSLLKLLSLEEKAGQMTNIGLTALTQGPFWTNADTLILDTAKMQQLLLLQHVGSVQNKGVYPPGTREWYRIIKTIQDYTLSNATHKIPILFGIDAVHGANYTAGSTLFPHQMGLAATWNPELAKACGEITAYELRASSTFWNYAPVLDISTQALWGRIIETFGEDTYLASAMGNAFIQGSQGLSFSDSTKVAVCLKHFVGYGSPYNGKDRSTAYIPENHLRQYYIEPFRQAIENGALSIMANSGAVNGIPGHADHYLLTTILKEELDFKGFVISDWNDIERLSTTHFVAENKREAAKIAVMAGIDMCMVPYDASFAEDIIDLVKKGEIPIERIDDAVRRILFAKFKLGLFNSCYNNPESYPLFGSVEFAHKSYLTAIESVTLLKNINNTLPLQKVSKKIFITGPAANLLTSLNGPWSRTWAGNDTTYDDKGKKTFLQAMQDMYGTENIIYSQGTLYEGDVENEKALLKKARKSDIIFVCLGEAPLTEKPSDINDLNLPDNQIELVKRLHKSGKPIVLILLQGRPRIIREIEPLASAILHAYWPGNEGGRALASLIKGNEVPSGKLPYTYPRYPASLQTYQHKGSDKLDSSFGMNAFDPQWQFGYGLSYSNFSFGNLSVMPQELNGNEDITVSITIRNTSLYPAKEVVQLYIRDLYASVSPDDRKLVAFKKVFLQPNESQIVLFTIPASSLSFVNPQNQQIAEKGEFEILAGSNPSELLSVKLFLNKTLKF